MTTTVLINGCFLLQPVSGVQRYAAELLSALARVQQDKYRYVVAVPADARTVVRDLEGVEILRDNSNMHTAIWQQLRLPLIAKKMGAAVLWSPCNVGPVLPMVPHIVSVFDGSIYQDRKWFDWKFQAYYKTLFFCYKYTASHIITCSNFSKAEIISHMRISPDKIDVLYGAISSSFKRTTKKQLVAGRYILSLGSRDPRKNIGSLVRAWRQMSAMVKNGRRLAIAGGGSKVFNDEEFAADDDDIVFIGYVKDEDLPCLYSGADCFVYPSFYEGFGLPPLEAMACGCPVVTARKTSLPEVCGDSACYIDPYSVESIAQGIHEVLSDENIKDELVRKGYETVIRFSWDKSALQMLNVLDAVGARKV